MVGAPARTLPPPKLCISQIARKPVSCWKRMSAEVLPSKSFAATTCQPAPGLPRFAWFSLPGNGLTLLPLLCQIARAPLSFCHKRSLAYWGLLPPGGLDVLAKLSKSASATTCQVGPVNGRLIPSGAVPIRPPVPVSSQIALSPKLSNRNRSPPAPKRLAPIIGRSPLKFPRLASGKVVMASPLQPLSHDESFAWI